MKKIINSPVNNVLTSEYIGRITSIREFNEAIELCAKHKDTDIVYKRIDNADAYVYSVSDATPNKACLRIAKWLCKEEGVYTSDFIIDGNNLEFCVYNGDNKMFFWFWPVWYAVLLSYLLSYTLLHQVTPLFCYPCSRIPAMRTHHQEYHSLRNVE